LTGKVREKRRRLGSKSKQNDDGRQPVFILDTKKAKKKKVMLNERIKKMMTFFFSLAYFGGRREIPIWVGSFRAGNGGKAPTTQICGKSSREKERWEEKSGHQLSALWIQRRKKILGGASRVYLFVS